MLPQAHQVVVDPGSDRQGKGRVRVRGRRLQKEEQAADVGQKDEDSQGPSAGTDATRQVR